MAKLLIIIWISVVIVAAGIVWLVTTIKNFMRKEENDEEE